MTGHTDVNLTALTQFDCARCWPALSRSTGKGYVAIVALALLLTLGGCRTETAPRGNPLASASTRSTSVDADAAIQSDPCAARMHDIAGALLMYYALNQHLPERLEELSALDDIDSPKLEFTCPLSHMPYVYVPSGLRADGKSKVIILHDAAATHAGGSRWCILMPDTVVSPSRSMEVLQLPEGIFRLYR
jgi:hypothetical protein